MSTFVVAGVTGRVGAVVARDLLARGQHVRAMVRNATRGLEWKERGADIASGSLADEEFLRRALDGADALFVLLPENDNTDDFHASRRRMADAVTAAVAKSGVPHVVLLSAIAAVLPDGNGPAKDLHYFERVLADTGAVVAVLRASYFQENVAGVIPVAVQAGVYPNFLPSEDVAFPQIATRDVGRIAAETLASGPRANEIIDLIGPVYSVRQVADYLGAALGKPIAVVNIPPAVHVTTLVQAGMPPQLAAAVAEMFSAFAAGLIKPKGDRQIRGTTTLDTVIAECVRQHQDT